MHHADATMKSSKRIVIVGGVAAGATAAARARRIDADCEIVLVERGPYISYANCGLPYFLSGDIAERSSLLLQTPDGFGKKYGVDVRVETEVVEIDRAGRRVRLVSEAGEVWLGYDKLILAQGGLPILPVIPGSDWEEVYRLWTVPDMDRLEAKLESGTAKQAVIVGGGFIGIEMAEAFAKRGLRTTVVEMAPALMSMMDAPFGRLVEEELARHGVEVVTGAAVVAIDPAKHEVELRDGRRIAADLVLFAVGVRPELELAKQAGLELGATGALAVSDSLVTSDPDILAAGDMVEVAHRVHGRKVRVPLAGPANRQGRIAATVAAGLEANYNGVLGTSIVKVMDRTAGSTGLSERAALAAGFDAALAVIHKEHHATYFPGAKEMTLALVYDRATHRLLGAQAFGEAGIESRINTLAVALTAGQTVEQIAELDLVYAPPYSSANDPVNLAAFVAVNDLTGFSPLVTAAALHAELHSAEPPLLVDVRTAAEWSAGHVVGSLHMPLDALLSRASELPRDRRIVVTCRAGYRGHLALRTLRGLGFEQVRNLTGGFVSLLQDGGFSVEVSR